jgi:hypothetical protein
VTYLERYHAGLLPYRETLRVLIVLSLVRGSRRHPDAPPLGPEEAAAPILDPLEIEKFCQLGVITRGQAEDLLTLKRGDSSRPEPPLQYQLF